MVGLLQIVVSLLKRTEERQLECRMSEGKLDDEMNVALQMADLLARTPLAKDGYRFDSLNGLPSLKQGYEVLEMLYFGPQSGYEVYKTYEDVLFGNFIDNDMNTCKVTAVEDIYKDFLVAKRLAA